MKVDQKYYLLAILLCVGSMHECYGQGKSFVFFDIDPGYSIETLIDIPKGCGTIKYIAKKKGNCAFPEIVSWDVEYRDCDNKTLRKTLTFEIPAGNAESREYAFQGANLTDPCVKGSVRRTIVQLPRLNDISVYVKGSDVIFDGETILFGIQEERPFNNINWQWIDLVTNKSIAAGKEINHQVTHKSKIGVRGRYGSSRFQTEIFPARIPHINVIGEILSFDLVYPEKMDDTSAASIKVRVRRNTLGNISWEWYKGADLSGKFIQADTTADLLIKPVLTDADMYTIYAVYDKSRKIASKSVRLNVNTVPGPDNSFELAPTSKEIYRAVPVWIKVAPKEQNKNAKWVWKVGETIRAEHADSILINNPINNLGISVYPILNTKKGVTKTIELNKVLVKTVLPQSVTGPRSLCKSDVTKKTYTLENAVLGTDTRYWKITDGKYFSRTFRGDTVQLLTTETTTYQITPGSTLSGKFEFTVTVTETPALPSLIIAPDNICSGVEFTLKTDDRAIPEGVKYNWYKLDPVIGTRVPIGEVRELSTSITNKTSFLLQTSYGGCLSDRSVAKTVNVIPNPNMPGYIVESRAGTEKKKVSLAVNSGSPLNLKYEWSDNNFTTIIGEGRELESYWLKKGDNLIYVRAKNECNVLSEPKAKNVVFNRLNYFFVNAGLSATATDISEATYQNMMLSFGIRYLYLRIKGNPFYLLKTTEYSTHFRGTELSISDDGRIQDFPPSTGYYYVLNRESFQRRTGYTIGTLIGTKKMRVYIGGGYGERDLLWNLDLIPYTTGPQSKVWARNVNYSWKGIEGEIGLFLKLRKFNLMIGASTIVDKQNNSPFIDLHLGIGFSTR